MKKFREYLIYNFLPVLAKETILKENEKLRELLKEEQQENEKLRAYIAGFEAGGKNGKIKIINTYGGVK